MDAYFKQLARLVVFSDNHSSIKPVSQYLFDIHSIHLPTAVLSTSVTITMKETSNGLSALRTSTWLSPSGTEWNVELKNTFTSILKDEEVDYIDIISAHTNTVTSYA